MLGGLGATSALTLLSHFVFILATFRLLRAVNFDKFLKPGHVREAQLLIVFIAIAVGFMVSEFFLSLLQSSTSLPYLFK